MKNRWNPHVTVAAIIARNSVRQPGCPEFLLVEESTTDGLRWNNPAGHLELGESPLEGAIREAREEAGCEFVADHFLGVYLSRFTHSKSGEDITYVRLAFAGNVSHLDPHAQLDEGIVRVLWLTLDELRQSQAMHRSPLVLQCIEDWILGKGQGLDAVYTHSSIYALTGP
jgi:phosphatase NudJ